MELNKRIPEYVLISLFFVCLVILVSYNPVISVLTSFLFMVTVIFKKRMYILLFSLPILLITFVPSIYVPIFRIPSPIGELRPSFIAIPLVIIFTIIYKNLKLDLTLLKSNLGVALPLFLFFVSNIITLLIIGNHLSNFRYAVFTFTLGFGLFLMVCVSDGLINPYKVIKQTVLISTAVCIIGFLEFFGVQPYAEFYLMGNPWFNYDNRVMDGLPRIASSIGNPLVLSGFLLMIFPFTLYLREKEKRKFLWNIIVMIHLLALLLTISRSALLIAFVVLAYYLLRNLSLKKALGSMFIFIIVGLGLYTILSKFNLLTVFMDRILFRTQSESFSTRAYAYEIVKDIISQHFFFGMGTDVNKYLIEHGQISIQTLDNIFLGVIAGSGVVGLAFFLMALLSLFNKYRRLEWAEKFVGNSMLITFCGMGLSYDFIFFEATWGVFWFMTGLLLMLVKSKKNFNYTDKQ